jgi:competence protein ComEC
MTVLTALVLLASSSLLAAETPPAKALQIAIVDAEGGGATLIVTPAGESVLIDPGYPGDRDAKRIAEAAKDAGISRIDHFISTHWHLDHCPGILDLVKLIPVEKYYDRGLPPAPKDDGTDTKSLEAYVELTGGKSKVLSAGDEIPLRQASGAPPVSLRCVVARCLGEGMAAPGWKECSKHKPKPEDTSDNARSLGFVLGYGGFRLAVLGDITWNVEHDLVCPKDRIGPVDLYQVTHHGFDISNNPLLLGVLKPRVAVMPNGPDKGASPSVVKTLRDLGAEVFQLHRNVRSKESENAPKANIANWDEKCAGEPVTVRVAPDGKSYAVKVGRSGAEKTFETRAR